MKKLKPALSLLLALYMVLALLSGCGSNNETPIESETSDSMEQEDLQGGIPEPNTDSNVEEEKLDLTTTEGQAKNAMKMLGIWDGRIADSYAGGDGSEYNPYQIANGAQLAKLLAESDELGGYKDTYFVLTSDIVLNDLSDWDFEDLSNNPGAQWTADWNAWGGIGMSVYFGGIFDGGGHTVYGLYNNGLFSNLEGTVSNIRISCSLLESGLSKLGGIVGYCRYNTTIDNCHVEESVIIGDSSGSIGGICGQMDSVFNPISNCSVDGIIRSSNSMWGYLAIGGIVGDASSSNIENCVNSARIEVSKSTDSSYPPAIYAGGICGITSAVVNGCTNTGDMDLKYDNTHESVSPFSSAGVTVGGIVGYLKVGRSGVLGCNNEGLVSYDGNVEGAIATKVGEIDTSECFDYLLCRSNQYMIVAREVESVTDIIEYIGVLDANLDWVVPLSTDTYLNPNGKLRQMSLGYHDYENRCKYISYETRYAGEDIFVVGQSTEGTYGSSPPGTSVQAYDGNNAKIFHVKTNSWLDIEDYSCAQSIWFVDGYYVAPYESFFDSCQYVMIVNSQTGGTETDIYCRGPVWLGRYSEGLFFSYDAFYDIEGNRRIDLSEYAGLIMNQPYFENGQCRLIAYNENGTKYVGVIDLEGNFISEFTAVN